MANGMETNCVLCEVQTEFYVFLYEIIFKINQQFSISLPLHQVITSHYSSVFILVMFLSEGRIG